MASTTYLGYGNVLLSNPLDSSGVTNRALMASPIVSRKATLSSSAYMDFQFNATTGVQMIGVDGLVLGSGSPSISFAFSNVAAGASELGTTTKTPSLTAGYETQAWILDTALTTAQFCRVTFTNCAAVGICWASPILNPSIGLETGMSRTPIDLSITTRSSLTGAATTQRRAMSRVVGINFIVTSDDEFADFDDFMLATGTHNQVLLIPGLSDARRNRDLLLGQLINLQATTHIAPLLQQWPFEIQQSL